MSLAPGTRLGPYEIASPLGAGGMGEVYRATDTNLGRDVAIKVLPAEVAQDPERLARFEREAKLLASLNHPNVAHVYGFESAQLPDGSPLHFLAMELVEGEDLAERLERGAIPIDESLGIAKQIAEGLEEAHEKGIVHRDLKPANVKLTPDGKVKVLDFGLAKAYAGDPATGSSADLSQSPTLAHSGTQAGVILGTAAYMSPEQARGKPLDKRADIWSFGVVLFEMLTGVRLFGGETVSDTLAAVLREDIPWHRLPPETPGSLVFLLRRCLNRDPRERLRDIGDAWVLGDDPPAGTNRAVAPASKLPWALAAVMTVVALAAVALLIPHLRETTRPVAAIRFQVAWPGSETQEGSFSRAYFALSPDGQSLALVQGRLWVRPLDALAARVLERTEGASYPFWSPDGAWIGFFADNELKKIELSNGSVRPICPATGGRGATWSRNGTIVFGTTDQGGRLWRVPEEGGTPVAVTTLPEDSGAFDAHRYPQFLPDGDHFLYLFLTSAEAARGVYVGSLDGSKPVRVLDTQESALYAPAASPGLPGHLLFRRYGALMAQGFDPQRLEKVGPRVWQADGVGIAGHSAYTALAVAESGALAFSSGRSLHRELVWHDRTGDLGAVVAASVEVDGFDLAPDEKSVALSTSTLGKDGRYVSQIWIQDLLSGARSPFTLFEEPGWRLPVWSPDGRQIAFATRAYAGLFRYEIRRKAVDMSGQDELVLQGARIVNPTDWSPDGRSLLYSTVAGDLHLVPTDGDPEPIPFGAASGMQTSGQFSPDGEWIAYASNQTGVFEVYVQPFPATGALRQISTGGGTMPRWRPDGEELFFRSADGHLMSVPVTRPSGRAGSGGGTPEWGNPQSLFEGLPTWGDGHRGFSYQPSADGQRFLVGRSAAVSRPPITVVLNWRAGLSADAQPR